eukprot:gene24461-biopygen19424
MSFPGNYIVAPQAPLLGKGGGIRKLAAPLALPEGSCRPGTLLQDRYPTSRPLQWVHDGALVFLPSHSGLERPVDTLATHALEQSAEGRVRHALQCTCTAMLCNTDAVVHNLGTRARTAADGTLALRWEYQSKTRYLRWPRRGASHGTAHSPLQAVDGGAISGDPHARTPWERKCTQVQKKLRQLIRTPNVPNSTNCLLPEDLIH